MSVVDRALSRLSPTAPWVHFQGPLTEDPFDLSVPEAMIAVMVAAVLADEVMSIEESARLTSALSTSRLLRQATGSMPDVVARVMTLLREHGRDAVLTESARTIPPEMRETVFANAVDLVFAEGRVEERGKVYLDELVSVFGLDDAVALKIVEVLAIKNRT